MAAILSSSMSVDCAIFGFDGEALKILLIKCDVPGTGYKLPGSMIFESEEVPDAAHRVLEELTGLKDIYLKMVDIFSDPDRIETTSEKSWLRGKYGVNANRIISVGYYALVKLNRKTLDYTAKKGAEWHRVSTVKRLAFDHKKILLTAFDVLLAQIIATPVVFELLPSKFSIRQLQNLYEKILDIDIDNRNFRKKLLGSGYIVATGDRESGVAHKPAQLYVFDKRRYERELRSRTKLNFINWHI